MTTLSLSSLLWILGISACWGACPSHWTAYQGSCYKLFKERYTFFEAKETCNIIGSDLVEMRNIEENNFVQSLAVSNVVSYLWIGLEDFLAEGSFVWSSSGQTAEFYNWQVGQPNANIQFEDCTFLSAAHGLWSDVVCESKHSFVCERSAVVDGAGTVTGSGIVG